MDIQGEGGKYKVSYALPISDTNTDGFFVPDVTWGVAIQNTAVSGSEVEARIAPAA